MQQEKRIIGYPIFDVLQTFLMIKNIEKNIGRQKSKKWSPRKIDIDILLWRNKIISLKFLSVPHKEFDNKNTRIWVSLFSLSRSFCSRLPRNK